MQASKMCVAGLVVGYRVSPYQRTPAVVPLPCPVQQHNNILTQVLTVLFLASFPPDAAHPPPPSLYPVQFSKNTSLQINILN